MKIRCALAALCLLPLPALSQTTQPAQAMQAPTDPGMGKPPADAGAVVTPPPVNDKSVATPPKNVDPKIDSATGDIDRGNRKKSEDRKKKQGTEKRGSAGKGNAPAINP